MKMCPSDHSWSSVESLRICGATALPRQLFETTSSWSQSPKHMQRAPPIRKWSMAATRPADSILTSSISSVAAQALWLVELRATKWWTVEPSGRSLAAACVGANAWRVSPLSCSAVAILFRTSVFPTPGAPRTQQVWPPRTCSKIFSAKVSGPCGGSVCVVHAVVPTVGRTSLPSSSRPPGYLSSTFLTWKIFSLDLIGSCKGPANLCKGALVAA